MRRTASLRVSATLVFALALALGAAFPAAAQISGTVADFTYTPTAPRAGETVTFTDASVGSIFGWFWSFGDGATSGAQNPTHTYASPGVYAVTLAVLDRSLQEVSVTKSVNVASSGAPGADFTFDPVLPAIGQSVQFTDRSSGSPTAWSWTFGDGGTSTQQNPTHAFGSVASFVVTLTATTASGSSSVSKTVNVQPAGVSAAFAFFPQQPAVGDLVTFQNLSTGSPTSFSWSFGDGGTSTESNPTHTFDAAGSFEVSLTASTASASDTVTQTITVAPSSAGAFSIRTLEVFEIPSELSNGNGKPEPGERVGIRLALTNGTTKTESSVVAQLLPWTWNAPPVTDLIDFGTVPAGAAQALADGRFEVIVDPSYPCDGILENHVRLFLSGGRGTDPVRVDARLPGGTCDPPPVAVPSITFEEPPPGTGYTIGSGVALSFATHGSNGTEGARIEMSRDGGATFTQVLSEGAPEMTGIGPHLYVFKAAPPASPRVRFRVTVALSGGASMSATTSRDVAFVDGPAGRVAAHLPVVVQGAGASQSYFTTDATIASPDGAAAVLLTFKPAAGGDALTIPDPIPVPRGSRYLPDVFQPFRDNGLVAPGAGLVGTLTATAGGKAVPVLNARVTNIPRNGVGSFGLAFGSRPEGQAVTREAWVSGMITSSAFRSNLSLAHVRGGSGGDLGLVVELWSGSTGQQVVGSPRHIVLAPDGFAQINNFQGFTVEPGIPYQYRIVRASGDDQFRAYGTIIDAVTGDPSYVEGAVPYGDTGEHVVRLASVVEAQGLYGSFFTSDVTIVNRSATSAATVSLRLDAQGVWEKRSAFTLGPRQARSLRGIVEWFRQNAGATLSGTVVGPLAVTFSGGDGAVLVRTSSPKPTPQGVGSFGLAFPGRRADELAQGTAILTGVRKSGPFRSNLALAHGGKSGPITLSYRVLAAFDGTAYGPGTATLQPGGFFQASDVAGALGAPAGFYDVVVTRTAGTDPWEAYLTILDNVTNDGSFVEMVRR